MSQLYFAGILQKMKEGAENVERKIQAKVESLKNVSDADKGQWTNHTQSDHSSRTNDLAVKTEFIQWFFSLTMSTHSSSGWIRFIFCHKILYLLKMRWNRFILFDFKLFE